jgi:hypothetical protein
MKIHYFIERKKRPKETSKPHQSKEKVIKHRLHKTKEKLICTPQISTTTQCFQLQNCQIRKQLNANRSQPNLGPLSFKSKPIK